MVFTRIACFNRGRFITIRAGSEMKQPLGTERVKFVTKGGGVKNVRPAMKLFVLRIQRLASIKVQYFVSLFNQMRNHVSADESRAACDNNTFHKR